MTPSSGWVSSGGHTRWFRAFSRTHLVCAISGANRMTSLLSLLHVAVVLQPYVMMTLFLASGTASSNLDREQQVFQPFSLQSAIRSVFSDSSGGPGRSFFFPLALSALLCTALLKLSFLLVWTTAPCLNTEVSCNIQSQSGQNLEHWWRKSGMNEF